MKTSLLIIFATLVTGSLFAQVPAGNAPRTAARGALPPPLALRQVSGIVKDSSDATLPGAVVKLESPHDTISTSTNMDGIFIFKNVKSATFVLTVSSVGYRGLVKKFLNNDAVPRLTLDPIVLKSEAKALREVVINGTPSIVYKVDTVEYRASDYKVRPNATLDELLKKMEGFEVGSDGSVTHQGQAVTKVKLNGKDYAGGDVAQAIQNLPAEIIDKAQVVDDYGDAAAHSGIKDGDPVKILNVTTKADRSVGTTGRLVGQAGNNDRYNGQLFLQRINGNQQIGVIANFRNTVTGVQSTGSQNAGGGGGGNSNPGTTQSFAPSLNYRDQLSKKVQVTSSGTYGFTKNNSTSNSFGNRSSSLVDSSLFNNSSVSQRNTFRRGINFELDYDVDSLNYLQIQPNYTYSTSENKTTSTQSTSSYYKDGHFEHQVVNGTTSSKTPSTTYGVLALFNHRFRKPGRNFSTQLSYNHTDSKSNGENQSHTVNYADSTTNNKIGEIDAHLITLKNNTTNTFRGSMTYSEPIGGLSRLELNAQMTHNEHGTNNVTDTLLAAGGVKETDLIFNYNTTETRVALNYRYNGTKVNLSLGSTLMPYHLEGTKLDNGTGSFIPSNISIFRVLPILRFSYAWSRTQRLNIFYTGTNEEPQFQQIQPFTDKTDPNNIVIGNPNLKAGLSNQLTIQYNNYFPNSRFNISLNGNAHYTNDDITTNTVTQFVPIPGSTNVRSIREINYVNITGSKGVGGNYVISKQLADRRYNLNLIGRVTYGYTLAMNQGELYHQSSWSFNERFGPRINPTDNVEFNPFFGTSLSRSFNSSADHTSSKSVTNSFGLDGKFYFFKTYQVHYDASKQFINQSISPAIANSTANKATPLIIDAGFQKEFGQRRQFTLTFDVYDLLHQNNYINQVSDVTGVTNTVSSSLSRYFLIGFRLNLQKWSGRPTRNGRNLNRRGDGSFIYN